MEPTADRSPFHRSQLQSNAYSLARRRRSATIIYPSLFIGALSVGILLFSFLLPSLISVTSEIVTRAIPAKKGWDSVNFCLVLFAILCGVFARKNDPGSSSSQDDRAAVNNYSLGGSDRVRSTVAEVSEPRFSEHYSDHKPKSYESVKEDGLLRTCNLHTDLRQAPLKDTVPVLDDLEVQSHRSSASNTSCNFAHFQTRSITKIEEYVDKVVSVDTFEIHAPPLTERSATFPPPSLISSSAYRRNDMVGSEGKVDKDISEADAKLSGSENSLPTPSSSSPPFVTSSCDFGHYQSRSITKIEECKAEVVQVDTIEIAPPPLAKTSRGPKQKHRSVMLEEEAESRLVEDSIDARAESFPPALPVIVNRKTRRRHQSEEKPRHVPDAYLGNLNSPAMRALQPVDKVEAAAGHETETLPPTPRPPPTPPEGEIGRLNSRRSKAGVEIKTMLASLNGRKRTRKKKTGMSHGMETYDNSREIDPRANEDENPPDCPPSPPPPPPPPLPQQPSLRNGFFMKGGKSEGKQVFPPSLTKRRDQHNEPPSSPPPLQRQGRPPLPVSGEKSASISTPLPPPPPPPFKMPEMKFVVNGDFARIRSEQSSRCGSPEPGETGSDTFCPSPDVNAKADNFIARLRSEWKLERMTEMATG